jgi:hypothetical protein
LLLHEKPDDGDERRKRQSRFALFDTPASQDQRLAAEAFRRFANQPALSATAFGN